MQKLKVTFPHGDHSTDTMTFEDHGYVTCDNGELIIKGGAGKDAATFAPGAWLRVIRED